MLSYRLVGASACADRITTALVDLADAAHQRGCDVAAQVNSVGEAFCRLKPDTGLYVNLVAILTAAARSGEPRDVADCASALSSYRRRARTSVVMRTADVLHDSSTLLVHDYSSMVMRVLAVLAQDRFRTVVVTAGEPLGQGRQVAAEAARDGHHVVYSPDLSVGRVIGSVDAFVTGVESFYADGSLANTVGTLMLSLLSREYSVKVVAPAESLKYDPRHASADMTRLTARLLVNQPDYPSPSVESWTLEDHVLDAVPAALITQYSTDQGVQPPALVGPISRQVLADWSHPLS